MPTSDGRSCMAVTTAAVVLVTACCAGSPTEVSVRVTTGIETPGVTVPEREEMVFAAIDVEEAARRLWPKPGPSAYAAASEVEASALADLVGRMLAAEPAGLAASARAAGYTIEGWAIGGERFLAAIEAPGGRRGGGAFVVRVGGTSPVILQAPHAFFDVGTERIALDLLVEQREWPRALFVNTIHRHVGTDGVKRRRDDSPADPCHRPEHLLAVATTAAIEAIPGAEVVQLHGFGDDPADTEEEDGARPGGPVFAAIVSGGVRPATERARTAAARLRGELAVPVALFPDDTDRLGALTNVQGRAIRAYNDRAGAAATFVHVEMSATLRRRLRTDAALRGRLAAALRPAASGP